MTVASPGPGRPAVPSPRASFDHHDLTLLERNPEHIDVDASRRALAASAKHAS